MAYSAPEGYTLDQNTGLYYTQVIAADDKGNRSQVVTWFNTETGEYRQDVYPVAETGEHRQDAYPAGGSARTESGVTSYGETSDKGQNHSQRRVPPKQPRRLPSPPKVDTTGDRQYEKNQNFMKGLGFVILVCLILLVIIFAIARFLWVGHLDKEDRKELQKQEAEYIKDELFGSKDEETAKESDISQSTDNTDNPDNTNNSAGKPVKLPPNPTGTKQVEVTKIDIPNKQGSDETETMAGLSDDEKAALAEKAAEEAGDTYEPYEEDYAEGQYLGNFIDADIDIPRAFAPVLVFKSDYKFEMMLNFNEGTNMYYGEYYVDSDASTGKTLLHLHGYDTANGIPATATVRFSNNNYDYCEFLDDGFGLMGYSGAPYGFYRDMRE